MKFQAEEAEEEQFKGILPGGYLPHAYKQPESKEKKKSGGSEWEAWDQWEYERMKGQD